MEEENGFSHFKSLNQEAFPNDESFISGGLCTAGRNGEYLLLRHDPGTMLAAPTTASEVTLGVVDRVMSKSTKKTMMTISAVLRWGISIFHSFRDLITSG